jgi:hypothetical protein
MTKDEEIAHLRGLLGRCRERLTPLRYKDWLLEDIDAVLKPRALPARPSEPLSPPATASVITLDRS